MNYTILLVEDEKWVRTALRKVIEKIPLPLQIAHEASNGIDATDWLESHEVDIIMTDIRMPVMDGITLLKEQKHRRNPASVIIISGHDDFNYAQQAVRQGAYDYFLKPVEGDELEACLRAWIEQREHEELDGEAAPIMVALEELSPVEQVVHQLEKGKRFDLTLSEAADSVHLNPSYFCKLFKQHMDTTFTDYVITVRMREAVRLLENTSLRITEIAERLGYTDPAYFSNTFKKVIGRTPSDIRSSLRRK